MKRILSLFVFRYSFTIKVDEPPEKAGHLLESVIKSGFELDESNVQQFKGSVSNGTFNADMITPDVRGISFAVNGEFEPEGAQTKITFHMRIKENSGLAMLLGFLIFTGVSVIANMLSRSITVHPEQFYGFYLFAAFGFLMGYLFSLGTYWGKSRLMERIGRDIFQPVKRTTAKKARRKKEELSPQDFLVFMLSALSLAVISTLTMVFFSHPWSILSGILAVATFSLFGGALLTLAVGSIKSITALFAGQKSPSLWRAAVIVFLKVSALLLLITGMALCMNGFLATCGFNPWTMPTTEIPIIFSTEAVKDRDENIYCYLSFACRFQKYDRNGVFLTGWPINSGGKKVYFRISEEGNLEAFTTLNVFYVYDGWGKLIDEKRSDYEAGQSFAKRCTDTIYAGDTALQQKINNQPFYLWFLAGPQCFILFAAGMLLNYLSYSETIEKLVLGGDSKQY